MNIILNVSMPNEMATGLQKIINTYFPSLAKSNDYKLIDGNIIDVDFDKLIKQAGINTQMLVELIETMAISTTSAANYIDGLTDTSTMYCIKNVNTNHYFKEDGINSGNVYFEDGLINAMIFTLPNAQKQIKLLKEDMPEFEYEAVILKDLLANEKTTNH